MTGIKVGLLGLGTSSFGLPFLAQLSTEHMTGATENLATRGTPYVLAAVIVALAWCLYKVFGLFLSKIQEREDDLKSTLKDCTDSNRKIAEAMDRMTNVVSKCEKVQGR